MTWKAPVAVYLVDGVRTPFLRVGRQPPPFSAAELAAQGMRALLARARIAPDAIDEVLLGCVLPAADEVNIARVAMLRAGLPEHIPALTVNRVCGSGMQAIDSAARNIAAGVTDVALAGGVESMSHAPVVISRPAQELMQALNAADSDEQRLALARQLTARDNAPLNTMFCALSDAVVGMRMGDTAEVLAKKFAISRSEQDAFALQSHQRALAAWEAGHFDDEITPLRTQEGKTFSRDTGMRPDTSMDKLAALKPVFDPEAGTVSAGNSSQITDGAAMVLLASERAVREHGLRPLARIEAATWAGLPPREMGLGPAYAIARLLREGALDSLRSVDFFEINEAFAAQVLACTRALADERFCREQFRLAQAAGEIAPQQLNVDGGAIAIGHPLGASGARIVLHLAHVLRRHSAQKGLAALCIGGGQGGAMLLARE